MSEDVASVCRLCMETLDLNHTMEDRTTLKMVEDCLQLRFTFEAPFLPAEICDDCYFKIRDFYEYKENCRTMQDLLQQDIEQFTEKNSVSQEVSIEADDLLLEMIDDDGSEVISESVDDDIALLENPPVILNNRLAAKDIRSGQKSGGDNYDLPIVGVEHVHVSLTSGKDNQIIVNQKAYHECSQCFRSYTNIEQLKRHWLTHKMKRVHLCGYCSMSFHQKSSLQSHIRSHTKEKPFVCQHCGNAYGYCQLLKKHLSRYHAQEPAPHLNTKQQTTTT